MQFLQQPQSRCDVLFVVDNSGSMMDEQQNLGRTSRPSSRTHGPTRGVDYHIAVTTTGLDALLGRLGGVPRWRRGR
jgi:superfamily II DNA or RNA helicase